MQVKEEAQQLALIFETVGAFKVKRKGGKGKQIFGTWVDSNATLKKFNLFVYLVDIDMFLQCYASRSGWHNQGTTSKVFSLKTGWINQAATVYDQKNLRNFQTMIKKHPKMVCLPLLQTKFFTSLERK